MEKYIITFEDGVHYVTDSYTESDFDALCDGILTIIRTSDCKELTPDNTWSDLPLWEF